jgi:hypothetical protein
MSRTPAKVTQADINRSIRAAKQAGAAGVEIRPDGTIFIHLRDAEIPVKPLPEYERPQL